MYWSCCLISHWKELVIIGFVLYLTVAKLIKRNGNGRPIINNNITNTVVDSIQGSGRPTACDMSSIAEKFKNNEYRSQSKKTSEQCATYSTVESRITTTPIQPPVKFTSSMEVEGWLKQVDRYTKNMSSEDKYDCLLSLLEPDCAAKLETMTTVNFLKNEAYENACMTLRRVYKKDDKSIMEARKQLTNRKQFADENIHAFGMEITNLVKKAFPDMDENAINALATEQFISGISNYRLKDRILDSKAKTMQALLEDCELHLAHLNRVGWGQESQSRVSQSIKEVNYKVICFNCQESGHFARECKKPRQSKQVSSYGSKREGTKFDGRNKSTNNRSNDRDRNNKGTENEIKKVNRLIPNHFKIIGNMRNLD